MVSLAAINYFLQKELTLNGNIQDGNRIYSIEMMELNAIKRPAVIGEQVIYQSDNTTYAAGD